MANSTLINNIDDAKQKIMSVLADCMVQINNDIEGIKVPYSADLIELLSVLRSEQNDLTFVDNEADALAKYFRSKGCTKEIAQFICDRFMSFWN